jgi:branched-chain amino acid transport system permease protein
VIFALPPVLQSLVPQTASGGVPIDDLTSIVYGVLIIAFFVFEPGGVVGLARRLQRVRVGRGEGREPMHKPDGEEPSPRQEQPMEERVPTWAK